MRNPWRCGYLPLPFNSLPGIDLFIFCKLNLSIKLWFFLHLLIAINKRFTKIYPLYIHIVFLFMQSNFIIDHSFYAFSFYSYLLASFLFWSVTAHDRPISFSLQKPIKSYLHLSLLIFQIMILTILGKSSNHKKMVLLKAL